MSGAEMGSNEARGAVDVGGWGLCRLLLRSTPEAHAHWAAFFTDHQRPLHHLSLPKHRSAGSLCWPPHRWQFPRA